MNAASSLDWAQVPLPPTSYAVQYDVVVILFFMLKYLCKALAFHFIGNLVSLLINAVCDYFFILKK